MEGSKQELDFSGTQLDLEEQYPLCNQYLYSD